MTIANDKMWLSPDDVAAIFGVGRNAIDDNIRKGYFGDIGPRCHVRDLRPDGRYRKYRLHRSLVEIEGGVTRPLARPAKLRINKPEKRSGGRSAAADFLDDLDAGVFGHG